MCHLDGCCLSISNNITIDQINVKKWALASSSILVVEEFEFIVAHRSELKLSKVKEWKLIEKLFIEAAVVAARVGVDDTAYEDSASNGSVEAKPAVHAIRPLDKAIGGQSGHRPIGGPTQEEIEATKKRLKDSGKDIETQCIECDQKFTHTINKQIEFAGKGWNKTPRKCPGCTDKQNKSRMCFDYMKGQCRHADLCRFSHNSDTPWYSTPVRTWRGVVLRKNMAITDRNGDSIQKIGDCSESVFSTSKFGSECAACLDYLLASLFQTKLFLIRVCALFAQLDS